MVGLILAGGTGSRLFPFTLYVNKHLINVCFQPLINYPLMNLLNSGLKEFIIVINPNDLNSFSKLLGDGGKIGIKITFVIQETPGGLPHAILAAKNHLLNKKFVVILGDIFFDLNFFSLYLNKSIRILKEKGSHIFLSRVKDGRNYGTVEIKHNKIIKMTEKPLKKKLFKFDLAMSGVYFFDDKIFNNIYALSPSNRGELEMVDLLQIYNQDNKLTFSILSRATNWYDCGNLDSLIKTSKMLEKNIDNVFTPEYLAFRKGLISLENFKQIIHNYPSSHYKRHNLVLLEKFK